MDELIKEYVEETYVYEQQINFDKFREKISKKQFNNKLKYLRKNIHKSEINKKIKTFISNKGVDYTINEIKDKIINDDLFAANFIKNESKQNMYEKIQYYNLKRLGFNCEKLPCKGKNMKYFKNGELINYKPDSGCKSIDFKINYKNRIILIFAKYTKEAGGAQDNQANDAILFLKNANLYTKNNNNNFEFWFLGDGEYYQKKLFQNRIKDFLTDKVKFHTSNSVKDEL